MTFPLAPQDPWQHPQHFGGPPQYQAPPSYDAPQQFGAPQPSGGSRKGVIIGSVAAALVALLAIVGTAAFFVLRPSADERQIKATAEKVSKAGTNSPLATLYRCRDDQNVINGVEGDPRKANIPKSSLTLPSESATFGTPQINSDRATLPYSDRGHRGTLYFRKLSVSWDVCMSDDPTLSNPPSLP